MIYLGIDTSGDHDILTPYVVSITYSDNSPSIEESILGNAYKEIKKSLGNYILHATNDSEKVRRFVVETLYKYDVRSYIIVVMDRDRVKKDLIKVMKSLVSRDSFAVYDNSVFDNVIKKVVKKAFKVSLSRKDSMTIPLQLADYFSYYWWGLFSGKMKDYSSLEKVMNLTTKVRVLGKEKETEFTQVTALARP
ncbi:hypothetical protein [Acidianus sp. HS-5]|uniref:hypothetical protein n=1 Tax=Acidianus sp. HS-5 TaxID=2886040 RepID=UPI001F40355C|nr:hypothetical protein [Acidianus sp. HS-5]BDC17592.1 hypothetical protein HS5_04820 [Acidianus sp. HS-5]